MTTLRVQCVDYGEDSSGVGVVNVHDYGWWEVATVGSSDDDYLLVYEYDPEDEDRRNSPVSVFPLVNVFGWWEVR